MERASTPEIPKELFFLNTEKSMHPEIHLLKPLILTVVTPIVLLFTTGVFGIFRGKGYPSREFLMSQLIC